MDYTTLFFGILFLLLGLGTGLGWVHPHLKEWQRMPVEEKEKINIRPLCWNLGGMIVLCGALFVVKGSCEAMSASLFVFLVFVWIILCGVDIVLMGKKQWYTKR